MSDLMRLSFSIEKPLYRKLESLVRKSGYTNRSEFIRDLVRNRLVEAAWESNEEALGTVTIIYDHHTRELSKRLIKLQHHHHRSVLASTHVHLDRNLCAEMIMVKGRAGDIRNFTEGLRREKGVLHASLAMGSTGRSLA